MPGIGIVHNPNARRNQGDPERAGRLSEILGKLGSVRETRTIEEIGEVAREYLRKGIEILGINGGDGTQHLTISKFISVYKDRALPAVVHLKGGTMNTIARSFRVVGTSAETILKGIIEKYRNNDPIHTVERELLEVKGNPTPLPEGPQYGFIFGSGIVSSFLKAYYDGGDTGPWKALKVILKAVCSASLRTEFTRKLLEPVKAHITVDATELPMEDFTVIYASTIKDVGLGFKVAYRAGDREGHFHCIAGAPTAWAIIRKIPIFLKGRPTGLKEIHDGIHRRMTVRGQSGLSYTIDGELYTTSSPLIVSSGPKLRMIAG